MTMSPHTLRLTELLHSKSETNQLVRSIISLLDDLLQSQSFVFKLSHDKRTLVCFRDDQGTAIRLGDAQIADLSHPLALSYSIREDLLIPNLTTDPRFTQFSRALGDPSITSAIVRRIRPVNHHAWGALTVFFRLPHATDEQRKRQLIEADLWVQLATTILERRIAEETLQTVEIRLDLATKAGGIGIYDWDLQSDEIVWNPQMYALFGLSEEHFSGKFSDLGKYIEPSTLQEIRSQLRELTEKGERTFKSSHAFIHSTGERRHLESLGAIIFNERNEAVRLIGTAYDDTEALRTKDLLSRDRRRLELALEAGELGFWDWNIMTGEVQFGGRWETMLGYHPNEIPPSVRSWEKLVHPDDMPHVQSVLKDHLNGKTPIYETEHRLKHKNGSWVWVLDRGRVVERDAQGKPIRALGIHADITQQHLLRERLREADRRKDEFLATLAHELRNPLAPIRTGLAIIKRDPTSLAAATSRDMMERQLTHMVHLIDDLLDVSRITTGRLRLKKEDTSLRSILEVAIEASKPMIEAAHHEFSWTSPTPDPHIYCDATRVAQSVSNLLTNAAKYTPDGGRISLSATTTEHSVEIAVTDNGLGVPPDMQEQIFDLFGQVNKTLDRAQGGLGIGLALVRNLISLHGGEVTVHSEGTGKGSTFTIQIPKISTARPTPSIPPFSKDKRHIQRRVLIVDDNEDAARSLSMYAEMLGHTSAVSLTGEDGLKQFDTFHPDLVFLDLGLPGIDGLEVARLMRKAPHGQDIQLVAITGWGTEESRQNTRQAGFDDHLTKPVNLSRIDRILAVGPPAL